MQDTSFFSVIAAHEFKNGKVLDISGGGKALVISDFHMGTGKNDDLAENGDLLISLLEEYYFKNGWNLVLNGDIEEILRHSLEQIQKRWEKMFRIFDLFAGENRLYKIIGNHDEALLFKRSYPYPLYDLIKIETGVIPAFVFHGHQLSNIYSKYGRYISAAVRYILNPLGLKNISSARSPYRRFFAEKKAYTFSMENNCLSIIGHTHRPLFESLGRFDFIKFEIERLCRDYLSLPNEDRHSIEAEVFALLRELRKLKRKEKRDVLRHSIYGDELPIPCLFNSGSAIGKKGIHAIEISHEDIALVYWFVKGQGMSFINRGNYQIEEIKDTPYRRAVLNQDRLDYISARIKLLGNRETSAPTVIPAV